MGKQKTVNSWGKFLQVYGFLERQNYSYLDFLSSAEIKFE